MLYKYPFINQNKFFMIINFIHNKNYKIKSKTNLCKLNHSIQIVIKTFFNSFHFIYFHFLEFIFYFMHRNSFNQQLLTSLNPDFLSQAHFPMPNPERFRRPLQRNSVASRQSIKSGDKKQYLTLVSKESKPRKRAVLKSSKKSGPKKIQSVILGG